VGQRPIADVGLGVENNSLGLDTVRSRLDGATAVPSIPDVNALARRVDTV
jgi:hypothetical protein